MFRMRAGLWLSIAALAGSILAAQAAPPRLTSGEAKAAAAYGLHAKAISANYTYRNGRWKYDVIVHQSGRIYEVTVDPITGKVLGKQRISAARERRLLAMWTPRRHRASRVSRARRMRRVRRHRR